MKYNSNKAKPLPVLLRSTMLNHCEEANQETLIHHLMNTQNQSRRSQYNAKPF